MYFNALYIIFLQFFKEIKCFVFIVKKWQNGFKKIYF